MPGPSPFRRLVAGLCAVAVVLALVVLPAAAQAPALLPFVPALTGPGPNPARMARVVAHRPSDVVAGPAASRAPPLS